MTRQQYAFRATWTEYHRTGPKTDPTPRFKCGKLWTFPDRTDPINGIDPAGLVAMARTHLGRVASEFGDTATRLEIVCESRDMTDTPEGERPVGSWEALATVTPDAVLFPDPDGAHNADGIRDAMQRVGRLIDDHPQKDTPT